MGDSSESDSSEEQHEITPEDRLRARPYQGRKKELFEKARHANSIIFLGTGSGKTMIATLLVKDRQWQIRPPSEKRTIFLVPSVPLVNQQASFLSQNITSSLRVKGYCGADGVDSYDRDRWAQEFATHHILVMVHQVFLDVLLRKDFSWDRVNLLVLDECHHAVKNHPYSQIMREYDEWKKSRAPSELPRIVGLSASIVMQKCNMLEFMKLKTNLEKTLDSKVITTDDMAGILRYVTNPEESIECFESSGGNTRRDFLPELRRIIDEGIRNLATIQENKEAQIKSSIVDKIAREQGLEKASIKTKKMKNVLETLARVASEIGIIGAKEMHNSLSDIIRAKMHDVDSEFHQNLLDVIVETLRHISELIKKIYDHLSHLEDMMKFVRLSSDKVFKLIAILEEHIIETNEAPVCIIFVKERWIAAMLAKVIEEAALIKKGRVRSNLTKLRIASVSGAQTGTFKERTRFEMERAMSERKYIDEVVRMFRTGEVNCVVATSVLEEGMDIKKCNLVIRFDEIQTFRSYVQSKGRARARPSKFIIMSPKSEQSKFRTQHKEFREIEDDAISLCHGTEGDDESGLAFEDEEHYYVANPNDPQSARVSSKGAVSLIYRYVQSIPTDRYTDLAPYFEVLFDSSQNANMLFDGLLRGAGLSPSKSSRPFYTCRLYLPSLSGIYEPIIGEAKPDKKSAKESAALTAIGMLHQIGKLTDRLLPLKPRHIIDESDDEDEKGQPKVGTKRRRRYYPKRVPDELTLYKSDATWHLHSIDITLTEPIREDENFKDYRIFDPSGTSRRVGIITSTHLDYLVSPFHLYIYSGKIRVSISHVKMMPADENLARKLVKFAEIAFGPKALGFFPSWYIPKLDDQSEYLMVPLDNDVIDVKLIDSALHNTLLQPAIYFDYKEFHNMIVKPKEENNFYSVESVERALNPQVRKPNCPDSYAAYYQKTHRLEISDPEQPLLRVTSATKEIDLRYPILNSAKRKAAQGTKTSDRSSRFRKMLIPELVECHIIPRDLWMQLAIFPFAMHRIETQFNCSALLKIFHGEMGLQAAQEECRFPTTNSDSVPFDHFVSSAKTCLQRECPNFERLLPALTTVGAGERYDLERLEFLGDSFLKLASSFSVFFSKQGKAALNEGQLTTLRTSILRNKALYKKMIEKQLESFFIGDKFEPYRNWLPSNMKSRSNLGSKIRDLDTDLRQKHPTVSQTIFELLKPEEVDQLEQGKVSGDDLIQCALERIKSGQVVKGGQKCREYRIIGDKALADSCEALIGCFLLTGFSALSPLLCFPSEWGLEHTNTDMLFVSLGGDKSALDFMNWMGFELGSPLQENTSGDHFLKRVFLEPKNAFLESAKGVDSRLRRLLQPVDVQYIEERLGYRFQEKSFLLEALTHCSCTMNKITHSYERLEFLGDAVIDYLVSCHLFCQENKKFSPGELTNLRSALVNNATFAHLIVEAGLHPNMLIVSDKVFSKITEYVSFHETNSGSSYENYDSARMRLEEDACPVLEIVEVPKVLGDLFEALIGAIVLDSGCKLSVVWQVIGRMFPNMDEIIHRNPKNFVQQIYEMDKDVRFNIRQCRATGKTIATLTLSNEKNFKGIGVNKKVAKEAAAKCALRSLENTDQRKNALHTPLFLD